LQWAKLVAESKAGASSFWVNAAGFHAFLAADAAGNRPDSQHRLTRVVESARLGSATASFPAGATGCLSTRAGVELQDESGPVDQNAECPGGFAPTWVKNDTGGEWECIPRKVLEMLPPPPREKSCCCPRFVNITPMSLPGIVDLKFPDPGTDIATPLGNTWVTPQTGGLGNAFDVHMVLDWFASDNYRPCSIQFWERTNRPYKNYMLPNEWGNLALLARSNNDVPMMTGSATLGPIYDYLDNQRTPSELRLRDLPNIGLRRPEQKRDVDRTLDGHIIVLAGCPECESEREQAHFAQRLKFDANGDPFLAWFVASPGAPNGPLTSVEGNAAGYAEWAEGRLSLWENGKR